VVVEKGETLINCLAYIDLNPLRAGLVKRPEEYRWNSIGYHVQTGNRGNFLSLDFGLREFGVKGDEERLRRYRRFLYETGAVEKGQNPQTCRWAFGYLFSQAINGVRPFIFLPLIRTYRRQIAGIGLGRRLSGGDEP
jgi:hypothetical protein